jgi:hypothetical protein
MTSFLRSADASRYLEEKYAIRAKPATLAKYRSVGGGPRFRYEGRFPLYSVADLDAWARERIGPVVRSTAELREVA